LRPSGASRSTTCATTLPRSIRTFHARQPLLQARGASVCTLAFVVVCVCVCVCVCSSGRRRCRLTASGSLSCRVVHSSLGGLRKGIGSARKAALQAERMETSLALWKTFAPTRFLEYLATEKRRRDDKLGVCRVSLMTTVATHSCVRRLASARSCGRHAAFSSLAAHDRTHSRVL